MWTGGRVRCKAERRPRPPSSHMSIHNTDTDDEAVDPQQPQCAELDIGEDEFVIYDRDNHRAWIQSSVSVPVDEKC